MRLLSHQRVFKSSLTKDVEKAHLCRGLRRMAAMSDAFRGCSRRVFSLNCLFKRASSHEFQECVNIASPRRDGTSVREGG